MTSNRNPPAGLAEALAAIAAEAGVAILAERAKGLQVAVKADDSPVTDADRRAEELILTRLAVLMPGVPVIAEESVSGGDRPEPAARFFLVDPLDGTREFIAGRDEFTVNIGLIEDGRPIAGALCAPALRTLAAADVAGAWETRLAVDGSLCGTPRSALRARPVPAARPVAVASRSHLDARTGTFLAGIGSCDVRAVGSSLKFLLVARGEADVYPRFGRTMQWDTAAGHAVLDAAGGSVVTAAGEPLRYGRAPDCANPPFIAWGRREQVTTA